MSRYFCGTRRLARGQKVAAGGASSNTLIDALDACFIYPILHVPKNNKSAKDTRNTFELKTNNGSTW